MSAESLATPLFRVVVYGDDALLVLAGELDIATLADFEATLGQATAEGLNLFVDTTAVSFMDVTTAGALVDTHSRLAERGGSVRVVGASRSLRRLFLYMGADQLLTF